MFFWYIGLSVFGVATIFRSVGVDYRLIAGLQAAVAASARSVKVRGDSKLVIEQVAGRWKVKQPHLRPLCDEARALLSRFDSVDLAHVRREYNSDADALVNAALDLP